MRNCGVVKKYNFIFWIDVRLMPLVQAEPDRKGSNDMTRDKLNGAAYDLSLFEAQKKVEGVKEKKKKDSNLIRLHNKEKELRKKPDPAKVVILSLVTATVVAVAGWIVCNNVVLNELRQEITTAESEIVHQGTLQAEFQARIDNQLTPSRIQSYAEGKLGMAKVKTAQKKFISLSDGDVGEVIRDDGSNTVLDSLSKLFGGS